MNSKERVQRAFMFQETDRIPLDMAGRVKDLENYLKMNSKEVLYEYLGISVIEYKLRVMFKH